MSHDRLAWAEQTFSGFMVDCWLKIPTEEATQKDADFLQKHLRVAVGARLLDVPCGGGRHALALAARGFRLTGVDASSEFLAVARAEAARRSLDVTWEHRDMTDLPWPAAFDGAYCFGNSFGYHDEDANAGFLRAVAAVLKSGGRFVLETGAVAESFMPLFKERWDAPFGDMRFHREARYDPASARYESKYTMTKDGRSETKIAGQRVYLYRELCQLFGAAGFTDLEGFGSLTGELYQLRSPNLYLTATKAG
jgi:SAM-dependent methyltransferase